MSFAALLKERLLKLSQKRRNKTQSGPMPLVPWRCVLALLPLGEAQLEDVESALRLEDKKKKRIDMV